MCNIIEQKQDYRVLLCTNHSPGQFLFNKAGSFF